LPELPGFPEPPAFPAAPYPDKFILVTPEGTEKVPDVLNVCVPPGTPPPPSTPTFDVPIAISKTFHNISRNKTSQ
jgi:hypothetical protein